MVLVATVAWESFYKTARWRRLRKLQVPSGTVIGRTVDARIGAAPGRVTLLSEQVLRIEPDSVGTIISATTEDGRTTIHAIAARRKSGGRAPVWLHSRFERLERAYREARAGRNPEDTSFFDDVLPAIFAAVPDTNIREITEMLDWLTRKNTRKAEELLGLLGRPNNI
jgi:hypothetical protein